MFNPTFTITPGLANILIKLESIRHEINVLPISTTLIMSLRETARINATHYSTKIEGNRLTEEEVEQAIKSAVHLPGHERDEKEVLGYYVALERTEELARHKKKVEKDLQLIHSLIMSGGKKKVAPTPYRDGQNVIRDSSSRKIVYLPPEALDVPPLMKDLIEWINSKGDTLACPLIAAIAHYQYATVHPYYDGNGRTARLLTTVIIHQYGYGLKGIYSLDEYYANDLQGYYNALTVGPSHNYYMGRAEADITSWIEYFCKGMLYSFESVKNKALKMQKKDNQDASLELKKLSPRQRIALTFFKKNDIITNSDITILFNVKLRTARDISTAWVIEEFLSVNDPSKKTRSYSLAAHYKKLL